MSARKDRPQTTESLKSRAEALPEEMKPRLHEKELWKIQHIPGHLKEDRKSDFAGIISRIKTRLRC